MLELAIHTLDVIGKILIALAAISVHHRFLNEHKIDTKVFRSMKREQKLAFLGIAMILISYFLELYLLYY